MLRLTDRRVHGGGSGPCVIFDVMYFGKDDFMGCTIIWIFDRVI